MRTRYGLSYWLDRYPTSRQPSYPRHRGHLDVQVAVLGGGLTGASIAYVFAAAGVRVAVLEADRIGQGGSGSCPGLLRLEPAVSFQQLQSKHGLRVARHLWLTFRRSSLDLAATIRRLRIRCELVSDAALRVGYDAVDEKILRREMQALRAANVEGTWLTPARLRQETGLTGVGAIRSAGDGYVDPYRVTLGLAAEAVKRRALVFERTTVTRVRAGRSGVELTTDSGTVRAGTIVVASNYPPAPFKPLRRHFKLLESYCVLTPAVPSFVRREFGRSRATVIDEDQPPHILRRTSDERVLFMGADSPPVPSRSRDKVLVQRKGQLMYELSKRYPAIAGIQPDYGWSVPVSMAPDGYPCIGPHRNYPHHLFAFGSGHNGIGSAYLAARVLLRQYLGEPEKGDEIFGFPRIL
ncbi:MAG: FAD-binding oxidoreductase [Acidobacteria bacterium]|nr:FAD-binding oxidoreductase [Acidobacteriota bacterium]